MSHCWKKKCLLPLLAALLATAPGCSPTPSPLPLDEQRLVGLGTLASSVDTARLRADVRELTEAHLTDEPVDCSGIHAPVSIPDNFCHLTRTKARALMRARLEATGLRVSERLEEDGEFSTVTLVAELPGTTHPEEVVLVGAHYDAFYAGADDNSSGVAAVLELARVLSAHRFERTVRFVGFDLEEYGLVGSTRYVVRSAREDDIVAALILDSISFRSHTPDSQSSPPGFSLPSVADFIAVISNEPSAPHLEEVRQLNERLGLTRMAGVVAPGPVGNTPLAADVLRSDHAPFWLADKPALFLTDTTNFRNPHFHQSTDTLDTIDPEFLAEVTRLCAAVLGYWAGGVP